MIIGLYAGILLSIILFIAAVTNLLTGKVFKSSSFILIALYFPAALFSGISLEIIFFSFLAAIAVMTCTVFISALFANTIPMNVIYFIGSVTPWVGTGKPLLYFLLTTIVITSTLTLLTLFFRPTTKYIKNPPVGFSIALAALICSPFTVQGITSTGFF